jgi:hypothetical protein
MRMKPGPEKASTRRAMASPYTLTSRLGKRTGSIRGIGCAFAFSPPAAGPDMRPRSVASRAKSPGKEIPGTLARGGKGKMPFGLT